MSKHTQLRYVGDCHVVEQEIEQRWKRSFESAVLMVIPWSHQLRTTLEEMKNTVDRYCRSYYE